MGTVMNARGGVKRNYLPSFNQSDSISLFIKGEGQYFFSPSAHLWKQQPQDERTHVYGNMHALLAMHASSRLFIAAQKKKGSIISVDGCCN